MIVVAVRRWGGPSRAAKLAKDSVLASIAAEHGVSAAQVAIASLASKGVIPLVGATQTTSLRELLAGVRSIVLSDADPQAHRGARPHRGERRREAGRVGTSQSDRTIAEGTGLRYCEP